MEVSLLISCRVPTYLMSDFEMSEMRDLGGAELGQLLAGRAACSGVPYPMYSDIFAACCEGREEGGGCEGRGGGCVVSRETARLLMLLYRELKPPLAESVRALTCQAAEAERAVSAKLILGYGERHICCSEREC